MEVPKLFCCWGDAVAEKLIKIRDRDAIALRNKIFWLRNEIMALVFISRNLT
jgi:hypothetical protein